MHVSNDSFSEFVRALTWSGKGRVEFLLYAVRDQHADAVPPPDLQGWPAGTSTKTFHLGWDGWPVTLDLHEIYAPVMPGDVEGVLLRAMEGAVSYGAILAWFMYDGAFGAIGGLFSEWDALNTYGVAAPERQPLVVIDPNERSGEGWLVTLNGYARRLYAAYPGLRALVPQEPVRALWRPAWYELDQPLEVGVTRRLVFYPIELEAGPAGELVFHNDYLHHEQREVLAAQGTIIRIVHPVLGALRKVDTKGLDYTFVLSDGSEVVVNAEEEPGRIFERVSDQWVKSAQQIEDWTLAVEIGYLSAMRRVDKLSLRGTRRSRREGWNGGGYRMRGNYSGTPG